MIGAMRRGHGWIEDLPDERDLRSDGLYGTSQLSSSARVGSAAVRDQSSTNACVGFSIAYAFEAKRLLGTSPISARLVYANAVHCGGGPVVDLGARLRDGLKATAALGIVAESAWPLDAPELALQQPPWRVYREAARLVPFFRYARLRTANDAKVHLASGNPVLVGTKISNAFMEGALGIATPPSDPIAGHAMCILDYSSDVFSGPNSWGADWGSSAGWFSLSSDYLDWEETKDLWAVIF